MDVEHVLSLQVRGISARIVKTMTYALLALRPVTKFILSMIAGLCLESTAMNARRLHSLQTNATHA